MSILQEYQEIRSRIGEKRYEEICAFLDANPQYQLSDVYYGKKVWDESVAWAVKTYGKSNAVAADAANTEEVPF